MKAPRINNGAIGSSGQFNALHDDASGSSALLVHQQLGTFSLATNPSNGQTVTLDINGTNVVLTAVSSIGSSAGNFLIGASAAATLANLLNLLQNPWTTNSTQIALSLANQQLLAYCGYALSGTTLTVYSLNTTQNPQLTSFSGSTTFTSGSWTGNTMALYVEPGVFYLGTPNVSFAGGNTPTFTAPVSYPRIDLVTINSSGSIVIVNGTENASPVAPTFPNGSITLCEVYHVVGETAIYDNANQQSGQGYIQADVRPFLAGVFTVSSNNGTSTRTSTGSQTIAHGLGRSPQLLRIVAGPNAQSLSAVFSIGSYNGTNQNCMVLSNPGNGNLSAVAISGSVLSVEDGSGNGTIAATATWDATNIYLSWSNSGTSFGTVNFMWEVM
jgi:hypothetical protein